MSIWNTYLRLAPKFQAHFVVKQPILWDKDINIDVYYSRIHSHGYQLRSSSTSISSRRRRSGGGLNANAAQVAVKELVPLPALLVSWPDHNYINIIVQASI